MPTSSPVVLHDYQQATKDFLLQHPHAAVFLDMGFGKTVTSLDTLNTAQPGGHILVIAPLNIIRSTWMDEIDKWGYNVRTKSLVIGPKGGQLVKAKRLERYQEVFTDPPTMYFINVDLVADLVENMPVKKIDGKKTIIWPFATVIIDESQTFKNPSSNRFKALRKVTPAITRMIEMTGTPTPQGLLDLWSQVYLLDQGQALGKTMQAYKDRWFWPTRHVNGRPVAWEPKPGAEEAIYAAIRHLVISVENSSLVLPPVSVNDVLIHLSPDELAAYKKFKLDSVLKLATINNGEVTITAANRAVLAGKLTQYASGTMYVNDSHDYVVVHERKIEYTDYLLRNASGPVIIAYRFRSDKERLVTRLTELGHQVTVFDGSREMVSDWNDGKFPVMLLQPASAAHGLNLQFGGHELIWYTLDSSLEKYLQTNARIARQGQQHPVMIHRLLTDKTYDLRIPEILSGKKVVQDALMDAVLLEIYVDIDDIWMTVGDSNEHELDLAMVL